MPLDILLIILTLNTELVLIVVVNIGMVFNNMLVIVTGGASSNIYLIGVEKIKYSKHFSPLWSVF
jgi:hypothetical protein